MAAAGCPPPRACRELGGLCLRAGADFLANGGVRFKDAEHVSLGVGAVGEVALSGDRRLLLEDLAAGALHGLRAVLPFVHADRVDDGLLVVAAVHDGAVDADLTLVAGSSK